MQHGMRWLLRFCSVAGLAGLIAVGIYLATRPSPDAPPVIAASECELNVNLTRSVNGKRTSLRIDDAEALPARAGDKMHLEIRCKEPTCIYVVRLDSQGKATPLYPWNMDEVEVTDFTRRPPENRPGRIVLSPMTIGNGWEIDRRGGMETVLLLGRRTSLPEDVRLGPLFDAMPVTKMRDREELVALKWQRGLDKVTTVLAKNRGADDEARDADRPLLALIDRLREHFDMIEVARFAHEGKSDAPAK